MQQANSVERRAGAARYRSGGAPHGRWVSAGDGLAGKAGGGIENYNERAWRRARNCFADCNESSSNR